MWVWGGGVILRRQTARLKSLGVLLSVVPCRRWDFRLMGVYREFLKSKPF